MAKVTGPLLSIGSSGQIGKSQVYANWKGINYARQHVVPANPRSTAQTTQRNLFSTGNGFFRGSGTNAVAPWNDAVKGRPLIARNLFLQKYVAANKGQTDLSHYIGSPGSHGGIPLTSLTADASTAGQITITGGIPDAPTDWTAVNFVGLLVPDQGPTDGFTGVLTEAVTASPTPGSDSTITFTGLTASDVFDCVAWIQWQNANGEAAYGPSRVVQATVS